MDTFNYYATRVLVLAIIGLAVVTLSGFVSRLQSRAGIV